MSRNINIGAVVIGRNEGERLRVCLESVKNAVQRIVYVDSGSTDNSILIAKKIGVDVVLLDTSIPFTAARARNAGFKKLMQLEEPLKYVQFIDGDCEIVPGWFDSALSFLESEENIAVVCGRRKERHPENSIYNMMCDIEWNTPVGEATACGGDAIFRTQAYLQVGGFRDDLIAGEEPELCVRIRQAGWQIWRIDHLMTLHDANMLKFRQWWKRTMRSGYAYAEGAYLHGNSSERHWVQETKRIWFWGGIIPIVVVSMSFLNLWWLMLFIIYPFQILRLFIKGNESSRIRNWIYAQFLVLGKFPELIGQLKFLFNLVRGRRGALIEYK